MSMQVDWAAYFSADEQLLWEGAPRKGLQNVWSLLFFSIGGIPFLLVGLVALAFAYIAFTEGGRGTTFAVFAFVFAIFPLAAGLNAIVGTWWDSMTAHKRVRYALSNQRAYLVNTYPRKTVRSFLIERDSKIQLYEFKGSAGTIFFAMGRFHIPRALTRVTFRNIDNAANVFRLANKIQMDLVR